MLNQKKTKLEKQKIQYSVISKPERFRRSGIEFSRIPTILDEDQITQAILDEPNLVVTKIETQKEE